MHVARQRFSSTFTHIHLLSPTFIHFHPRSPTFIQLATSGHHWCHQGVCFGVFQIKLLSGIRWMDGPPNASLLRALLCAAHNEEK